MRVEKKPIDLDGLTTTPVRDEVFGAMEPYFREVYGSPSSGHGMGLAARDALGLARERCAQLVGAGNPGQVVFFGTGTEALNGAIRSFWQEAAEQGRRRVVMTRLEHPAVWRCVEAMEGTEPLWLETDGEGRILQDSLDEALKHGDVGLAVFHLVNHDLGTVQDLRSLAGQCRERGVAVCVDGCHGVGWEAVDLSQVPADGLVFSPHRFYGPKGVGVLVADRPAKLRPLLYGGAQEGGVRPGMENVAAIVGAGRACELAKAEMPERIHASRERQVGLWRGLEACSENVYLNGPDLLSGGRAPHHLSVRYSGVDGEALMLRLDLRGVRLASHTGCAVREQRVPASLRAIGVADAEALGTVLMGIDPMLEPSEVDRAVLEIAGAVRKLRDLSPRAKG